LALGIGTAGTLCESRTLTGGTRPWGLLLRVVLVASVVGGYILALSLLGAAASARRLWWGLRPRLAFELGGGVLLTALAILVAGGRSADALVSALQEGTTSAAAGRVDAPPAVAACALEAALLCRGVSAGDCAANVRDADPTLCVAFLAAGEADAAAAAAVSAARAAVKCSAVSDPLGAARGAIGARRVA